MLYFFVALLYTISDGGLLGNQLQLRLTEDKGKVVLYPAFQAEFSLECLCRNSHHESHYNLGQQQSRASRWGHISDGLFLQ